MFVFELTDVLVRFPGSLEDLIRHGLHALRETLQQDKELTINNTSIGIVGPGSTHENAVPPSGPFRILEGEKIEAYLKSMIPKGTGEAPVAPPPVPPATSESENESSEEESGSEESDSDEDVQMAE